MTDMDRRFMRLLLDVGPPKGENSLGKKGHESECSVANNYEQ